jgi:hypothetical protein
MDGFFWDGDEFQAEAKDGQCGCGDNLLGRVVIKLLVGGMGKIDPRGGFAQHMTCIQMGGDCKIGNKSVVLASLHCCLIGYLRNLVGFAAFFPSNDTFRLLDFFFPLALAVALLFTPRLGVTTDLADFFLVAMGVSLFLKIPVGVFFVPLPLTFLGDFLPP